MQEKILENIEKGFFTCTIFCDLPKAFDTIDQGSATFFALRTGLNGNFSQTGLQKPQMFSDWYFLQLV